MQEYFSNKTIEKLKYDLVREKFLSFEDLTRAEELSLVKNLHVGQILIQENLISEETLLKFIENNLHIPYVNLENYTLDIQCLDFISAEDAKKHKILPLFRIEDTLTIAMADPLDLFVLNNLIKSVNLKIEPVICSERLILEAINKYYFPQYHSESQLEPVKNFDWRDELNSGIVNEFQAEQVINAIIYQALSEDAYEIVLENTGEGKTVKFKKDNKIFEKGEIPVLLTPLFNSRFKSLSGLDPNINELPQLGKFNFAYSPASLENKKENIVSIVATFPTVRGERITIKLYRPPEKINELCLKEEDRIFLEKAITKPGIILVSGPSLSGKSFIAYSILNSLDKTNKNIITIESIAKYDLPGVNQCELKEKVGFNFEKAVKFINFQSPDIVYIEEALSGKDIEYIALLAESGKTIITEILAENTEDIYNKLDSEHFKVFKQNVNCLIFVENKDRIQILK